jgi:hypothetical protein
VTAVNPRDHAHHPEHSRAEESTDSAGQTWHERVITSTGFDDDRGQADEAFVEVLRAHRAGTADDVSVMAAVAAARLLVPVTAMASRPPDDLRRSSLASQPDRRRAADDSVDMAVVTLVAPTGERAQPAFTSLAALADWNADARPVPVTTARAAQAAVSDGCDVIVLDPGTDREVELRPSMVWALAQQREWLPAHADPFVAAAVAAAVAPEDGVAAHDLSAGDEPGVLRVSLELVPGLSAEEVRGIATRVGERLATDGETRARIDGLAFAIR